MGASNGGEGAELMVSSDGTLGLGVNQQPEFGTFSSANKITIDPNASASNWVFFAVTYDASRPVQNSILEITSLMLHLDLERYSTCRAGRQRYWLHVYHPRGSRIA